MAVQGTYDMVRVLTQAPTRVSFVDTYHPVVRNNHSSRDTRKVWELSVSLGLIVYETAPE